MNIDRVILTFAGTMVLGSLALGYFISPWWFLLTCFVGANLFQAGLTGFCPAAIILARLGVKSGCAFPAKDAASSRISRVDPATVP